MEELVLNEPATVVFDHFAQADAAAGVDQRGFASLVRLLKSFAIESYLRFRMWYSSAIFNAASTANRIESMVAVCSATARILPST